MKHIICRLSAVLGLLLLTSLAAHAQQKVPFTYSNTAATNLAVIIIGPDNATPRGSMARVSFASVSNDLATSVLKFYRTGAPKVIANASFAGTNRVTFSGTTGTDFAALSQVLIVRRKSTTAGGADTWERMFSTANTATSVTFAIATSGAVRAGDEVYIATAYVSILVGGAVAKEWDYQQPIYNGQIDRPVLVETLATALGKIPLLSGWWEKL